ncbi:hypothetical protein ACS0TY_006384 [Phlomoides rotata]
MQTQKPINQSPVQPKAPRTRFLQFSKFKIISEFARFGPSVKAVVVGQLLIQFTSVVISDAPYYLVAEGFFSFVQWIKIISEIASTFLRKGSMGESAACLVRSFSNPSPTSTEEKKGNPLQRALTTSISFGRFMSESLDWEKWSAFTQNRHLEEVEKYSRPGSVAEKKAYFEAHFKRRRAAALLEQQNATAGNISEVNKQQHNSSLGLGFSKRDSYRNMKEEKVQSSEPVVPVDTSSERTLEDVKPKGIEQVKESLVLMENPVESTNHLENDGCFSEIVSRIEAKLCKKDDTSWISLSSSEKKPQVSSERASPVKAIKPVQLKNSEKTPQSKSKSMDSSNKRRSYTTSLQMPTNFGPCSGVSQKDKSKALPNVENSRIVRAPTKKYKNSVFPSTRASANGHHSDENNRIMRPLGGSISQVRTVDGKAQSLSSNYSKFSILSEIKKRTPTVASSFMFKSEERAVKRREKLEQKMKSEEAEKHQMHAKPQVPTVRPSFQKIEERLPASKVVQDKDTRPPWRLSAKTERSNDLNGKNSHLPSYSRKCFTKKSMNENASPNIQL